MLPRTAGLLVLFTVLSVSTAGLSCFAQQAESATPVRYHFGDDTRWADPAFNDSAWPVAQDGRWPVPAFYSDGFVWARVRVPANAAGQLGIRLQYSGDGQVDALFVNGLPVTSESVASHNTAPSLNANDAVLELPPGRTLPGSTSVVAFRVSYRPETRMEGGFGHAKVEIDNSRILHLESHADHFSEVLANGPDLVLNVAILILGVALFSFWRWVGGRDVLLCSALLISYPVLQLFIDLSKLGLISVPFPSSALVYFALQAIGMAVTVEFIWTVHGLRLLPLKRLAQISFVVFNAAALLAYWPTAPLKFVSWSVVSAIVAAQVFNVITFAVNFSVLFFRKRNRLIAAALALIPVASILGLVGIRTSARIGPIHLAYFNLAFFLCEFALFFMLGQRAWRAWRARDELRVEFEAAREVQEQLVPPAVGVPGFEIESAYVPAKHVGGDFFRILPGADGSVLVVVGDVSGKGLKAAMTVSAIMGALHDYPSSRPTEVLAHLNRVLHGRVGHHDGRRDDSCKRR
jgi:sigma-B regulation protein RsbU (phosphoserine phosphatase)